MQLLGLGNCHGHFIFKARLGLAGHLCPNKERVFELVSVSGQNGEHLSLFHMKLLVG